MDMLVQFRRKSFLIALIISFFSIHLIAQSSTYYVSTSGNDVTGDGSLSTPWQTIQGAINNSSVVNGDVIIVKDGTYSENVNVTKEITIQSQNGYASTVVEAATTNVSVFVVSANNVTIDGFTVYGTIQNGNHFIASIYLTSVSNCTISNNCCGYDATHYSEKSIMLNNSDNNLISNNICKYSPDIGLQLYGGSDNNTVQNNICSNNGYNYSSTGSGITNSDLNNTLRNNTIENNTAYGLHIYSGTVNLGNNDVNDKGNNTFRNNGLYDVYNNTGNTVNAYYNYWESNDAIIIDSHIYDNDENGSIGEVYFDPWLDTSPLPVELTTFTISVKNNSVLLNWQTATEVNNYGFNVERKLETGNWNKVAFVEGHGNSNSPKFYSYEDNSIVTSDKYLYRLKQIDIDGQFEYSKTVEISLAPPSKFELDQNYPNPFNPTTTIKYSIPNLGNENLRSLQIIIYDFLGRKVKTLVNEIKQPGNYEVQLDASELSSGIYYYTLQVGSYINTKKMILLK